MQYTFIEKAQQEPDLQEVVNYLSVPLHIIEELYHKFPQLSLTSKVDNCNQELYHKCDRIINYFLPNLINNYCHFSLKYRNEHIIKKEETKDGVIKYTAKDLLLNDISKVIEEIHIIEKQFNEHNKYEFLVTNRLVSDLGKKANILHQEIEYDTESVNLKNEFNYNDFKKQDMNHIFVKTNNVPDLPIVQNSNTAIVEEDLLISLRNFFFGAPVAQTVQTPKNTQENTEANSTGSNILPIILLPIAMIVILSLFNMSDGNKKTENQTEKQVVVEQVAPVITQNIDNHSSYFVMNDLASINSYIKQSYKNDNNITVNNDFVLTLDTLLPLTRINFNKYAVFGETTVNKNNDAYTITLNNISSRGCSHHLQSNYSTYKEIKINNKVIDFKEIEPFAIEQYAHNRCELPSNKIELTALK